LATENVPRITVSIFEDCRQSETSNFEMAQHIDKRIPQVSSMINALENSIKLGAIITQGVFLQPMENVGQRYK